MSETTIARERVNAGLALLCEIRNETREQIAQAVFPNGFVDCAFDVNDLVHCTLGRLYGFYDSGLRKLDLCSADAPQYGFDGDAEVSHEALTAAWEFVLLPDPIQAFLAAGGYDSIEAWAEDSDYRQLCDGSWVDDDDNPVDLEGCVEGAMEAVVS